MKLVEDVDALVWHAAASLGMGPDEDGRGANEEEDILPGWELLLRDGEGKEGTVVIIIIIIAILSLHPFRRHLFCHSLMADACRMRKRKKEGKRD